MKRVREPIITSILSWAARAHTDPLVVPPRGGGPRVEGPLEDCPAQEVGIAGDDEPVEGAPDMLAVTCSGMPQEALFEGGGSIDGPPPPEVARQLLQEGDDDGVAATAPLPQPGPQVSTTPLLATTGSSNVPTGGDNVAVSLAGVLTQTVLSQWLGPAPTNTALAMYFAVPDLGVDALSAAGWSVIQAAVPTAHRALVLVIVAAVPVLTATGTDGLLTGAATVYTASFSDGASRDAAFASPLDTARALLGCQLRKYVVDVAGRLAPLLAVGAHRPHPALCNVLDLDIAAQLCPDAQTSTNTPTSNTAGQSSIDGRASTMLAAYCRDRLQLSQLLRGGDLSAGPAWADVLEASAVACVSTISRVGAALCAPPRRCLEAALLDSAAAVACSIMSRGHLCFDAFAALQAVLNAARGSDDARRELVRCATAHKMDAGALHTPATVVALAQAADHCALPLNFPEMPDTVWQPSAVARRWMRLVRLRQAGALAERELKHFRAALDLLQQAALMLPPHISALSRRQMLMHVAPRFSIYPTTGRIFCSSPNIQTIPTTRVHVAAAEEDADATADEAERLEEKMRDMTTSDRRAPEDEEPSPHKGSFSVCARDFYRAPPGHQLVAADYRQIELRVLAHLSQDPQLLACFADSTTDVIASIAALVYGAPNAAAITEAQRSASKIIVYGLLYGIGDSALQSKLAHAGGQLGPAQLRGAFRKAFPKAVAFMEALTSEAILKREAVTLSGRVRSLAAGTHGHGDGVDLRQVGRQGASTVIQGSAADILKGALAELLARPAALVPSTSSSSSASSPPSSVPLLLCAAIHDEIVLAVPDNEAAVRAAAAHLESCMTSQQRRFGLNVALPVRLVRGPSLGQMTPLLLVDTVTDNTA